CATAAGRWMIGAPATRRPGPFRAWSVRVVKAAFVAWLFVYGPGAVLAPKLFGFSVVSTHDVTIYYQRAVAKTLVEDALKGAEEARAQNLAFWGPPAAGVRPIDIYLCDSRRNWQQLALWPGANAVTYGSSIFISPLAIPESHVLSQVITHEMSHAFLNQRLGYLRALAVPAWINEGIATYVAQNLWATDQSLRQRLNQSAVPELVPATELRNHIQWRAAIDGAASRAALTYGHAQSLCASLINEFGPDRVKSYLDSIALFATPDSAFQTAFGTTIAEADGSWLAQAKSAGQIPQATAWVNLRPNFVVVALSLLPFALLMFAAVWLIRLVFLSARFLAARLA
ncbi:MAG TPA: hypothetical protein VGM76_12795, partial [Lacipirellulaceae bacterium]